MISLRQGLWIPALAALGRNDGTPKGKYSLMASLTKICPTSDIAEGTVKAFEVGTNVIAVYNVGGEFFATDNECTHGAASLAEGILEDDRIECTLHFGAFNVKTGEAVQAPCFTALRTYKVVVQDGQVCVDLEKTAAD
jgi:nitrite reductase/ring-hydroxylating ferredoxin subunit